LKSSKGCGSLLTTTAAVFGPSGYGHTKGVKPGQTISRDQAEQFLREDVGDAEAAVNRLALTLSANQFSALVSFTFNLGAGGLQKLVSHGFENIAERMLLFDHDNGKRIAGLTRRRQAERALFLTADPQDNEYGAIGEN